METTGQSQPRADESVFRMIDAGGEGTPRRHAIAQGKIALAPAAFDAARDGTNPKGNVLALAEVAGIMAAKRVPEALPLCHSPPLQSVRLGFRFEKSECSIVARCEVATSSPAGVEMEALAGVNGALLAIYDLSKAIDPAITIREVRLDLKEGEENEFWLHAGRSSEKRSTDDPKVPHVSHPALGDERFLQGACAAVITISDRASAGEAEDHAGPAIRERLQDWGAEIAASSVVPDEKTKIQSAVRRMTLEYGASLVITTGGTGLSPRDVTPEAIMEIADRIIPGIGECLRQSGARHVGTAWLSRSVGVLVGRSWVIALPGNERAASEGLDALRPLLSHGLHMARGMGH